MKQLWNGFKIAFGMYSIIPVAKTGWDKENMKYAVCFFPLIGGVIGTLVWCWAWVCQGFGVGTVLFGVGLTLLPIFVSGGIHLDGFCDTVDGLSSHQNPQRKLEILKDAHVGAFALIYVVCYLLLYFGVATALVVNQKTIYILALSFVLSRALSGFSIVTLRCAKNSGLLKTFADGSHKAIVRGVMLCYIAFAVGAMAAVDLVLAIVVAVVGFLVFIYYRQMSYKEFGGITGDLAGFFLQVFELAALVAVVMVGGLR